MIGQSTTRWAKAIPRSPSRWENLGRTIATFGFLEEVLGKAIFAFTATTRYPESDVEAAFDKWLPTLERALIDPLAGLIDAYGKAVRNNSYQISLIKTREPTTAIQWT